MPLDKAEPPEPPEAGKPTSPFWPKIGRTEVNLAQSPAVAAIPFANVRMRAGRGLVGVVVALKLTNNGNNG